MKTDIPEDLMKKALCQHMHLSRSQLDVMLTLHSFLQPWQKEAIDMLLNERAADKNELSYLKTMLDMHNERGNKASRGHNPQDLPFQLPGGYQVETTSSQRLGGVYHVFKVVRGNRVIMASDLPSEASAIATAYELDRNDDPFRWRPVEETCPRQTMLLFANNTWLPAIQRREEHAPVHTGYFGDDGFRIFGASWQPTHWCYQPVGPQLVPPAA